MNKAYLKQLDRKYNRLFKGKFSTGRLTNTSKSVYSFEGEVLSEEDDEYNSDSSLEDNCIKDTKAQHLQAIGIDEQDELASSSNKEFIDDHLESRKAHLYPFGDPPEVEMEEL